MSGTILLADDSLTIQKVVELTFADTNYRVVAVSSGDELLERLGDSRPDLIICDVIMPGKDGYEVCQQIKSSSEWLHLPVILLTGTFEPFDRDRAIAAGCSEIITKPFEARKLVDTVERLVGGPDIQTPQAADASPAAADGGSWPDEATPIDVPTEVEPVEFGTQLSAPAVDEDGIEFTTSGFAEMEAAGRAPDEPPTNAGADDNLEYEFGSTEVNELEGSTPTVGPPPELTDASAQTVRIDLSSIGEDPEGEDHEPDFDAPPNDEMPETIAADPEESTAEMTAETAPEPFAAAGDEPFEAPPEAVTDEVVEDSIEDEPSGADTSPVDPPAEDDGARDETPAVGALQLTDDDIDRIARRVVELASDRLDQIAWEVVPDMAEIVVRQRIRELEAESESSTPDPVQ